MAARLRRRDRSALDAIVGWAKRFIALPASLLLLIALMVWLMYL